MDTPRRQVIAEVAARMLALRPDGFLRVAIDGVDGAGKTTFADELAAYMRQFPRPVIRASVDGFHHPRAVRYRLGRNSPEGYFRDSYDYAALRRELLDPLGPHGSGRHSTAVFDHQRDEAITQPTRQAPPHAVLILDGIFLHRDELHDLWDLSVYLDVPFAISIPRGAARGPGFGSADPAAPSNRRYVEGQRRYIRQCQPARRASIVIDNSDLAAPRIVGKPCPSRDRITYRAAGITDIPAIFAIRLAVRENVLSDPASITHADVAAHLGRIGCGWVAESGDMILGFALANRSGLVWALFVAPGQDGRGIGTALLDHCTAWLREEGVTTAFLETGIGTRAEGFYRANGWRETSRSAEFDQLCPDIVATTSPPPAPGNPSFIARGYDRRTSNGARNPVSPPSPSPPHLTVGGRRVEPLLAAEDRLAFALDGPVRNVRLRAHPFRPVDVGDSGDDRVLGLALTGLRILAAGAPVDIPVWHPFLDEGFHPPEPGGWRWTNGDALLPDRLFAGLRSRFLLVISGFLRGGAPAGGAIPPRPGATAFLAGDSYPADRHVEDHLLAALHPFLAPGLIRQEAMAPPELGGVHERDIAARMLRLGNLLRWAPSMPVLIGRSSGARVATCFAASHPVGAVICLGYPFRAPGPPPEPDRVAHLAVLDTPTLILQGADDPYGGPDVAREISLSPRVTVEFIEGGHEFSFNAEEWARLARRILRFLAAELSPPPPSVADDGDRRVAALADAHAHTHTHAQG